MKNRIIFVLLLVFVCCCCANAAENGLAAYFKFDEGKGSTTTDSSGNNILGTISNPKWVKVGDGYALELNGVNSFVDCGEPKSLDIRDPITLSIWVCPAGTQYSSEPGILGKQFSSYLLTYYLNRRPHFYINMGGNSVSSTMMPGNWSLLTGVFDGKELRIFVNGKIGLSKTSNFDSINPGGKFFVGLVPEDTTAIDPNVSRTGAFKGLVDEVRVYNRALSNEEVAALYSVKEMDIRNDSIAAPYAAVAPVKKITKGTWSVVSGKNGSIEISNGISSMVWDSKYSYPGDSLGWNSLSDAGFDGDETWKPKVKKLDNNTIEVSSKGKFYSFTRKVRFAKGRIELADTLKNNSPDAVAIIVDHNIIANSAMRNRRIGLTADNPLIYFSQTGGDFGIIAEDNIGRLQFEAAGVGKTVKLSHSSFALDKGKSYTFKYAVYPLKETGDVYDIINRVRNDWKSNFTIDGPWSFFRMDPTSILYDSVKLKKQIEIQNLRVVSLSPWLEYDPDLMDRVWTRDEFKAAAKDAYKRIKAVAPHVKVIGCIETDWVTLYPEQIPNGKVLYNGTATEFTKAIKNANLPWMDAAKIDTEGNMALERYTRGGKPQIALAVYPAPGNAQEKFLLDQATFLMDDCGLDGFYIDEFNQAWSQSIRSYNGWDGYSVNVDVNTGKIINKFINCSLVGIDSRVKIINAALKRGKSITTNTWATSMKEQPLPAMRFWEMQSFLDIRVLKPGQKPPLVFEMCSGLLASTIGLGVTSVEGIDLTEGLMLGMISYLRHGLLYYYYWYNDLPETGPGSGDYGPIKHMFPFTPIEIREGWMKGKERILAATSFETDWIKKGTPKVMLFNLKGREVPAEGKTIITGENGKWHIKANINNWSEILVIE